MTQIDQHGTADQPDLANICGQEHVKRALEVAACGGHSLLISGWPGYGKSVLAQAIGPLLPPLQEAEYTHLCQWYTQAFLPMPASLDARYRPIHQAQPNWVEQVLNGLAPLSALQHGTVLLERPDSIALSPLQMQRLCVDLDRPEAQDLQLLVTMQPCPCGFYKHPLRPCQCSSMLVFRHQRRGQALLERFPMAVDVAFIEPTRVLREHQANAYQRETSAYVRQRVMDGYEWQRRRFVGTTIGRNAAMDHAALLHFCPLDSSAQRLFQAAIAQLRLSLRASDAVLSVARTIADLSGCETIAVNHLAEAIQYQPRRPLE